MSLRIALVELQSACRSMLRATETILGATEKMLAALPPDTSKSRLERIVNEVAGQYGYTFAVMKGRERTARIVEARHVAIWQLRRMTEATLSDIGRLLARDHASISYALESVENRMSADSAFRARVMRTGLYLDEQPNL